MGLKMKQMALSFMLLTAIMASPAHADSYDPATNQLTIDSIQVGGTLYSKVIVTVGNVVSIGESHLANNSSLPDTCSIDALSAGFKQIKYGMTIDQVNQAFGCAYSSWGSNKVYTWIGTRNAPVNGLSGVPPFASIYFDIDGATVRYLRGGDPFSSNPIGYTGGF